MSQPRLTNLLPTLVRPREKNRFDLFEVMHHGTHEKQLSNVFAWLLTDDASHHLGSAPVELFVEEINGSPRTATPIKHQPFNVWQEVNTAPAGEAPDIADIVLIGDDATIVVENFGYSDGHGHSFQNYLDYGQRETPDGQSAVVLLCEVADDSRLKESNWEDAVVITYRSFLSRVCDHVAILRDYPEQYPAQHAFFEQLRSHFLKGDTVNDQASIDFVAELCNGDEADLFGRSNHDAVAEEFGERIKEATIKRIGESREMLSRVKLELKRHAQGPLMVRLATARGEAAFDLVQVDWSGSYQWSIQLHKGSKEDESEVGYILFGPTAWLANEDRREWLRWIKHKVADPDYSHVFLVDVKTATIKQSRVSLGDVLTGLGESTVLADELNSFLRS